jgi:hypothetical protein
MKEILVASDGEVGNPKTNAFLVKFPPECISILKNSISSLLIPPIRKIIKIVLGTHVTLTKEM